MEPLHVAFRASAKCEVTAHTMRIEGDLVVVMIFLAPPGPTHIREWSFGNAKPFDHGIRHVFISVASKAVDRIPDWRSEEVFRVQRPVPVSVDTTLAGQRNRFSM